MIMPMKWFEDPTRNEGDIRHLHRALWITLCGNILLAAVKWAAAVSSGSSALKADAWNSISDVLYSLTLVIGLLISVRPPDLSHPHGHERFEPVTGLVISLSMGWAGTEALTEAIGKLRGTAVPIEPGLPIIVLLFSAGVKCLMFFLVRNIAKKITSSALENAAEDNLMDTMTSAAAAGGILLSKFIHPFADPIAGILLSVWIFRGALQALSENLNYLTGHGARKDELYRLKQMIEEVPGVRGVHQLFAEYVGTKLRLDVHIDLDGSMPLREVHAIETEIEDRMAGLQDIDHIFIHAEPIEEDRGSGSNGS